MPETKSKMMSPEMMEKIKLPLDKGGLSDREKRYFQIMWAKSGVLYITAKPGVAKSAIARSIAKKMGFEYVDIRLSMCDEVDMGLYPSVADLNIDGEQIKCLDFVVPRWAVEANKKPTIIHFEELNRSSQQVRNAALQILLERQIGSRFNFNENVLMMSSGNLGDEDGTDVEEFDAALNNRLIHLAHTLSFEEWVTNFAIENVHPSILGYLKAHPEHFYKKPMDSDSNGSGATKSAYATPRSWTFLSDFILANYGKDASPREFVRDIGQIAMSYVGASGAKFVQYCDDMLKINISDILNRYDEVQKDLTKYNRDKKSELIQSARDLDLKKITEKQLANLAKFLKTCSPDELTGYLVHMVDNVKDSVDPKFKPFFMNFKDELRSIQIKNNE